MGHKSLFNKLIHFTNSVYSVTYELSKDEKPDHLTTVQYDILVFIALKKQTTPSHISECLHISIPNVSRELKKLAEHHLIIKTPDVVDRRKQLIELSEQGGQLMEQVYERIFANFKNRVHNASQSELDEIDHAIDLLKKHLYF
ncbi:MarR family transcriptional regulator [Bacillus spongiae]|uniref:MarR family transcriptional regulator n=1 Tax=Bacillus spongiae TaxID=2683610 RepID=A0ABU8HBZ0_9BACI